MNIMSLMLKFSSYMQTKNTEENGKEQNYQNQNPFVASTEFKEFLIDELNLNVSVASKDINEIFQMSFENGKFVDSYGDTFEKDASLINGNEEFGNLEINLNQQNEEMSVTDVLNNLLDDESFVGLLDSDESGALTQEEINFFLQNISHIDGNENDLSFTDILTGVTSLQDGTLILGENVNIEQTDEDPIEDNKGPIKSSGSHYSGDTTPTNNTQKTKSYSQMSKEELATALSSEQNTLEENKTALSNLYSGSNSDLQALAQARDNAYQAYQDQLKMVDTDMAAELDKKTNALNVEEANLDKMDMDCINQEDVVADKTSKYDAAKDRVECLKSAQSALNSTNLDSLNPEDRATMQAKKEEIKTQIQQAEKAEQNALIEKQEAETKLTELQQAKEIQQGKVDTLKLERAEYEMEIAAQHPEIQIYQNEYEAAKKEHDDFKANMASQLKETISTSQKNISSINSASAKKDNTKEALDYTIMALYDEEMGRKIAEEALKVAATASDSVGCGRAVRYTLENLGFEGIGRCQGKDWAEQNLANNDDFVEITDYISLEDIKAGNVPLGAIVCFSEYDSFGYGSGEAGHVATVVEYNGKICEASGYVRKAGINNNIIELGHGTYRIFIPRKK